MWGRLIKPTLNIVLFQLIKVTSILLIISTSFISIRNKVILFSGNFYISILISYIFDFFPFLGIIGSLIFSSLQYKIAFAIITGTLCFFSIFLSVIFIGFLFVIPSIIIIIIILLFSQLPFQKAIKDLPEYKSLLLGINNGILFYFLELFFFSFIELLVSSPTGWTITVIIFAIQLAAVIGSNVLLLFSNDEQQSEDNATITDGLKKLNC